MSEPNRLIIDPLTVAPVDRGIGVVTIPYVGAWNSTGSTVTTGQTVFAPGTELPLHSHNVEESVLILEGEALAQLGETQVELVAGQATWVPAGLAHRFANRATTTLRIYWVYGGREVTRTITATGETLAHLPGRDRDGRASR